MDSVVVLLLVLLGSQVDFYGVFSQHKAKCNLMNVSIAHTLRVELSRDWNAYNVTLSQVSVHSSVPDFAQHTLTFHEFIYL